MRDYKGISVPPQRQVLGAADTRKAFVALFGAVLLSVKTRIVALYMSSMNPCTQSQGGGRLSTGAI